ncbi:MAG TPA: hypothetical protein VE860_12165, partial [Chthoniobacterales bacterium]|nr:hypothetical protein [Chthoniobacterales bacterium]
AHPSQFLPDLGVAQVFGVDCGASRICAWPTGKENNWVQTIPGKGAASQRTFSRSSLYGPSGLARTGD